MSLTYSNGYYYFGYSTFSSNNTNQSFSLNDCPIVVKEKIVSINPKVMKLNFEYYFEYLGQKMVAIKRAKNVIDLYEILESSKDE